MSRNNLSKNNLFKKISFFINFTLLCSILCSCGATINKAPELDKKTIQYLALIPPSSLEGVSRERAEYINELIRYELESKGYIVLSNDIVSNFCSDSSCSNRKNLKELYNIDEIAMLNLESTSSNDFLLGYYNSISGKFSLEKLNGEVLYSASNTYRDSGGLILQSGQVIQAIINQSKNGDKDSMDKVNYKFITSLLKELPNVKKGIANTNNNKLFITDLKITPYNKTVTKICIAGNPSQSAWLVNEKNNTAELKEINSGQYCGAYRLEGTWSLTNKLKVELRSPFGDLTHLEVNKK